MSTMQLSDRQQQILFLLSLGKSNKEIAYDLKITEGTVKQHLFMLYKKLGATNRTRAVIAAANYLMEKKEKESALEPSSILATQAPQHFIWRLVSAVAIYPKPKDTVTPLGRAAFNQQMNVLQVECQKLCDAFDGLLTVVPGIGIVACFGVPKSHLDDSARAIMFATRIHQWVSENSHLNASFGIATAAEVVADHSKTIYRAESFEMAAQLAIQAPALNIVANEVTCRLAGPIVKYSSVKNSPEKKISYREIILNERLDVKQLAAKNVVPFLSEITQNLQNKQAMWVCINGWPPHHSLKLQDAIAFNLEASSINTYRLRLPTDMDPEHISESIYTQLNLLARIRQRAEGNEIFLTTAKSHAQKLQAALKILTMRGNLVIVLYGINSHQALINILGKNGISELAEYPIVFVTSSIAESEIAHITAKTFGKDPLKSLISKSFQLPLAKPQVTPGGIHSDLSTLLDNLSENSRMIVRHLTAKNSIRAKELGGYLGEVMATGLFIVREDVVYSRDDETLKSLKALYVEDETLASATTV